MQNIQKKKIITIFAVLLFAFFISKAVFGELTIGSIIPAQSEIGQNIQVTITGTGFSDHTQVWLYLDDNSIIEYPMNTSVNNVGISDGVAFTACTEDFRSIDIQRPKYPIFIDSLGIGGIVDVDVQANYVYAVDSFGGTLSIIDIREPAQLKTVIDSFSFAGPIDAKAIAVSNDIVIVTSGFLGSHFLDITEPSTPQVVKRISLNNGAVAISDGFAYIANHMEDCMTVVNIQDPESPYITENLSTDGNSIWAISIYGTTVFAGTAGSLYVFDVSDPLDIVLKTRHELSWTPHAMAVSDNVAVVGDNFTNPNHFEFFDISDLENIKSITSLNNIAASDIFIDGKKVLVAGGNKGLILVALPEKMVPESIIDGDKMIVNLPSPEIPGSYTLQVSNGVEKAVFAEAVSFIDPLPPPPPDPQDPESEIVQIAKAIIVAAGGSFLNGRNNRIWNQTQACTAHAYQSLRHQGLSEESIFYVSQPETDVVGVDQYEITTDILAEAILSNSNQLGENEALLVYMMDHGTTSGFELGTDVHLSIESLRSMIEPVKNLVLVIDSCFSGELLDAVAQIPKPEYTEWVFIGSASNQVSVYDYEGMLSFSYQFFSGVRAGRNMEDSFNFGKNMMQYFQTASINSYDAIAKNYKVGIGTGTALDPPVIESITCSWIGADSFEIQADLITSSFPLESVWCNVLTPCFKADGNEEPITEIPRVELMDFDGDGVFKGVFSDADLHGGYQIISYASFVHEEQHCFSAPVHAEIYQHNGVWCKGDLNADCKTDLKDALIALRIMAGENIGSISQEFIPFIEVDMDGRIGFGETLYILRKSAMVQ